MASRPRAPIRSASSGWVSKYSMARAMPLLSHGSTRSPQPASSIIWRHRGKSDATTGTPALMYSNSFTGRALRKLGIRCKGTRPTRARPSSDATSTRPSTPSKSVRSEPGKRPISSHNSGVTGPPKASRALSSSGNNDMAVTASRKPRSGAILPT